MEEQRKKMADEQLKQELRKSKGGRLGGKILSLLGVVIAVAGMILGGNYVVVIAGGVILALGQMVQGTLLALFSRTCSSTPLRTSWMQRTRTFPCPTTRIAAAADMSVGRMRG